MSLNILRNKGIRIYTNPPQYLALVLVNNINAVKISNYKVVPSFYSPHLFAPSATQTHSTSTHVPLLHQDTNIYSG